MLCLDKEQGTIPGGKCTWKRSSIWIQTGTYRRDIGKYGGSPAGRQRHLPRGCGKIPEAVRPSRSGQSYPFPPLVKYSGVSFEQEGTYFLGAFEFIFPKGYGDIDTEQYAKEGCRVLVLAHSDTMDVIDNKVAGGDEAFGAAIDSTDRIRDVLRRRWNISKSKRYSLKLFRATAGLINAVARRAGMRKMTQWMRPRLKRRKYRSGGKNTMYLGGLRPRRKKGTDYSAEKAGGIRSP